MLRKDPHVNPRIVLEHIVLRLRIHQGHVTLCLELDGHLLPRLRHVQLELIRHELDKIRDEPLPPQDLPINDLGQECLYPVLRRKVAHELEPEHQQRLLPRQGRNLLEK